MHPIVQQIIDRDCHVGMSNRAVMRHVISQLKHGWDTFRQMPKADRKELLRQCRDHHRETRDALMSGHSMLSTTHFEWARMWEWLCDLTGHYTDCNPDSKECWQYTGTFWKDRPAIGSLLPLRVLVHQFRHRDRPVTAKPIAGVGSSFGRVTLELVASHEYSGNWNRPLEEGSLA